MTLKTLFPMIALVFISGYLSAQLESKKDQGIIEYKYGEAAFQINLTQDSIKAFRSLHLNYPNANYKSLTYRFDSSGEWQDFYPDPHANEGAVIQDDFSTLIIIPRTATSITLLFKSDTHTPLSYKSEVFYQEEIHIGAGSMEDFVNRACLCTPPTYQSREDWDCPWGEDSTIFIPTYSEISHIVVHHQAGAANPPYANTVRSIWNFHVNSNGWSDIGYHWLIDPDGVIYKGRAWLDGDQNVQGAHICACNSNKIGICLLGDLTNNGPTEMQYESLVSFIAAKGCELDIPPMEIKEVVSRISGNCVLELTPNVIGHREGCPSGYTACPGDAFFPKFDILVADAQEQYEACLGLVNDINDINSGAVTIVPNPNNGQFILESDIDIESITIFDASGQAVYYSKLVNSNRIPISLEANGYFFAKINDRFGNLTFQKIIVVH